MTPFCVECNQPHNLELAPDTGECQDCGGKLVEDPNEIGGLELELVHLTESVADKLEMIRLLKCRK